MPFVGRDWLKKSWGETVRGACAWLNSYVLKIVALAPGEHCALFSCRPSDHNTMQCAASAAKFLLPPMISYAKFHPSGQCQ